MVWEYLSFDFDDWGLRAFDPRLGDKTAKRDPEQKHRENRGKRIDRRTERHRQRASPANLEPERGEADHAVGDDRGAPERRRVISLRNSGRCDCRRLSRAHPRGDPEQHYGAD